MEIRFWINFSNTNKFKSTPQDSPKHSEVRNVFNPFENFLFRNPFRREELEFIEFLGDLFRRFLFEALFRTFKETGGNFLCLDEKSNNEKKRIQKQPSTDHPDRGLERTESVSIQKNCRGGDEFKKV